MKTAYKIFPEQRLIVEFFSGSVLISDIIELKKQQIADKNYNSEFGFIVSLRDIKINTKDISRSKEYIEQIRNIPEIVGARRTAILTEKPEQVVVSTVYTSFAKGLPMNFKIVSTIKGALDWIVLPQSIEKLVDDTLEEFRNQIA